MRLKILAALLAVGACFTGSGYLETYVMPVAPEEVVEEEAIFIDPNVPTHVVGPLIIEEPAEENIEVEVACIVEEIVEEVTPQPIDDDFDILQPCGYTLEELEYAVSGKRHCALRPYVDTLLEAEKEYGVNAFYLLCKFGYESGWGRYMAADNNIGGWKCKDGSFKDFDSVEECIMHIAENLSTVYVDKVGSTLDEVCGRYCPDDGYLETLMQIMNERTDKIEEL